MYVLYMLTIAIQTLSYMLMELQPITRQTNDHGSAEIDHITQ